MKAENTKERKREEKERKGKDPVCLIFFVFLDSPHQGTQPAFRRPLRTNESGDRARRSERRAILARESHLPKNFENPWTRFRVRASEVHAQVGGVSRDRGCSDTITA